MKLEKNKAKLFLLDLIFPNRCPCCNSFISWNELLCAECSDKLLPVSDKLCEKCGKLECLCSENNYSFDKVYACYEYLNAKNGIISLKKGSNPNFGIYVGNMLADLIISECQPLTPELIIPVPMSASKKRTRGYNQAEVIANALSGKTGVPLNNKILAKKHSKYEQHSLNANQRKENTGSFYIKNKTCLNGKTVILCDDVLTTGNTTEKCTQLLKSCGASYVIIAVGATTLIKNEQES